MNYFFQEWPYPVNLLVEYNLTFPPHLHNTVELIHVVEGSLQLDIVSTTYSLSEGDFAVVFPGQLHALNSFGHTNKLHIAIFQVTQIPYYAHALEHEHPVNPVIQKEQLPDDILMAFNRLYCLDNKTDPRIWQAWIHLIMANLFSVLSFQQNDDVGDTYLVVRILEYLSDHFSEPISLTSLAKELHVNKYYLSHTFSNKLYISFTTCLNRLRIEKAMELLKTTDLSIETIGEMVGFETQRTFNRVFKKTVWLTPSEYRHTHFAEINRIPMPDITKK